MATAAAAAIIRKEKQIVAAYRSAGAVAPGAAKAPGVLGIHQGVALRRLRARAVLREAEPGQFYLDEPSWEALRALRRRLAVLMIVLVVVLGIVAFLGSARH